MRIEKEVRVKPITARKPHKQGGGHCLKREGPKGPPSPNSIGGVQGRE